MADSLDDFSKEELLVLLKEMNNKINSLQEEVQFYKEQIALSNKKRFMRSSEKTDDRQLTFWAHLFNEPETIIEMSNEIKDEDQEAKKNIKKGPNQKHITKGAVAQERDIHHDLSEEDKKCRICGETLRSIGEELAYVEMVYHPGYYEKVNHYQKAYVCPHNCIEESEGPHGETAVYKAELPQKILPKSSASPSLLAKIIYDKFEKSLPLYRQEKEYMNVGFDLSRQTMANWIIRTDELYIRAMIMHMKKRLDQSHVKLIDETRTEVLQHPEKEPSAANAYMWAARTGPYEEKAIVIFEYKRGRDHKYAYEMAGSSQTIIQSDGYEAYDKLENIHIGCWAHTRRYFTNALDSVPKGVKQKDTTAYELKTMIDKMFAIERKIKNKGIEERLEVRKKKTAEVMDRFFKKVHECREVLEVMPTTESFKKAINYAINQESKLRLVLEYGEVDLSTNSIETTIRNFTIGRSNWLFFNTERGAQSGADMYSLIVTTKENKLKPYEYLEYLFEKLPETDLSSEDELESLMPWSPTIPERIKKPKKA